MYLQVTVLVLCFKVAVSPRPGSRSGFITEYGTNKFVEYQLGDAGTNVILTSPHGGSIKPSAISDRSAGCYVAGTCVYTHDCGIKDTTRCGVSTLKDLYTRELSIVLADELQMATGQRPHVIINNLHRVKLDANREIAEATLGNLLALTAYNEFNAFMQRARNNITQSGGGILFDIHGQSHSEAWVELGYLITTTNLNTNKLDPSRTSVKNLAANVNIGFNELIRGSQSLGGLIQKLGYKTVPSPAYPSPGTGGYYSGGHITRTYGSLNGGVVDAVQIESPRYVRDQNKGPNYAKALARAIKKFLVLQY